MKQTIKTGIKSEYDKAKYILVSPPGQELFYGIIHPRASSFEEDPFDYDLAREEHENFKETLEKQGVKVVTLEDILMHKLDHNKLQDLASNSLEYVYKDQKGDKVPTPEEDVGYKEKTISKLRKKDLLKIILENPKVILQQDEHGDYQNQGYEISPIFNHYFQRDPQITTDKGVVIGKMCNEVRKAETKLAEVIFETLGIEPIYKIQGDGKLEGGDYIPAGDFALLGEGYRTNQEAIDQLLENNVFDFPEIAVVHDHYHWKGDATRKESNKDFKDDEMHLDTYFELIAHDKALIVEDRLDRKEEKDSKKLATVTVYKKTEQGNYEIKEDGIRFPDYLRSKGINVIPVPKECQLNYGINILTLEENKIIAVKQALDQFPDYHKTLIDEGIEIISVDAANLTKGYGGPHCMTQVLKRESL